MACSGCAGRQAARLRRDGSEPGQGRVAVYEVVKEGRVKLRTSSPIAARQEAKLLGATVGVTSQTGE